jgi:hypothetical protein
MATLVLHGGSSFEDGYTRQNTDASFSTMRSAAGQEGNDAGASAPFGGYESANTGTNWNNYTRAPVSFDGSGVGAGAIVTAITLDICFLGSGYDDDFSSSYGIIEQTLANFNDIVGGDFDGVTFNRLATDIAHSAITFDAATFNTWTFNAAGRAYFSTTGGKAYAFCAAGDIDNSEPSYVNNRAVFASYLTNEETVSGDKRPYMTVTYTPALPTPRLIMF